MVSTIGRGWLSLQVIFEAQACTFYGDMSVCRSVSSYTLDSILSNRLVGQH